MFENLLGKLHVHVIETDLPNGWWGAYDITTNTIGLRRLLAPIQRRSTLSHELAHEELSATWLIRHCDFQHAARIYSTPTALAHELNVLPRDVHAYARFIQRTQK